MAVVATRIPEAYGSVSPGAVAFEVTKPITLHVLDEEVAKAHGWRTKPGLTVEGDLATASEDSPIVVWVLRDDVDEKKFAKAVEDHSVETVDDLQELRDKIHGDKPLSPDELQQTVKLLAKRLGI